VLGLFGPKNYQNLIIIIGFQVTVEKLGDVFLRHSVVDVTQYSSYTPFTHHVAGSTSSWLVKRSWCQLYRV